MSGAMIIAPMMTATLFSISPSVAITHEAIVRTT